MTQDDPTADDLITLSIIEGDIWRFDAAAFVLGFGMSGAAAILSGIWWWYGWV